MTTATERLLNQARRRFKKTGNPLEAWDSHLLARQSGVTVPNWVLDYFEDVARELFELQTYSQGEPLDESKLKALNAALPAALGFTTTGRGASPWQWLEKRERDRKIGIAVQRRLDEGAKLYIARGEVAEEFGLAEKTVRDAYERFDKLLEISWSD